jgi:hypothetical protein
MEMSNHTPIRAWVACGTGSLFQRHLKWRDTPLVTGCHDTLALDIDYLYAWLANSSARRDFYSRHL